MINLITERSDSPHVLTVNLEDYFQVGAFNKYVQWNKWGRFECRVEMNVARTLDLLDRHKAKATFFVLGWIAEHYPHVVAAVAELGPSTAGQIEAHLEAEPRGRKGPWWGRSDTKWVAEALFASGVFTTATRVGFARHYDLTENVLPPSKANSCLGFTSPMAWRQPSVAVRRPGA